MSLEEQDQLEDERMKVSDARQDYEDEQEQTINAYEKHLAAHDAIWWAKRDNNFEVHHNAARLKEELYIQEFREAVAGDAYFKVLKEEADLERTKHSKKSKRC